ncbi:DUF1576 domain-containing protein [Cellulosilyticum sp. I15G10I2]|uniref:DUF1576 domain-containing protein n=1 Tax=Cellulosilyticum sp. I15G10I2 TaxID=1892843 RepID=UPI00085C9CA9|nr:DUF1576 domain-containing protein [Cellulosilyticum sp. I15G10I2]
MILANNIQEKEIRKEHVLSILLVFPITFLLFGLLNTIYLKEDGILLIHGLRNIMTSPTILITDFLEIGGIGASFINSALIGFINLFLLKHYKMKINGLLIAAFMTVLGFSFFGKNIFNILPIYLGGYLYAFHQKISMKDILLAIMFSTSMAPIVSEISFAPIFLKPYGLILGISVGVLIGFIIVPLSSHMLRFHDGFNLYNIGFTSGIVGTVFTSILRSFKKEIMPVSILYLEYNAYIIGVLTVLFIYLIIAGRIINKEVLSKYKDIFKYRGRIVTDFTQQLGYGVTFVNMGAMGLLSLLYVIVVGGIVNGPVLAGIFTVVGFAAFGKHPKNCFPIVFGVVIAAILMGHELSATGIIISVLFSTTIAPIAGTYGVKIGILAGMLHLALVTNIGVVHGGINLYNNGFSGGLVAGFLIPIIDAFKKGEM